MAYSSSSQDTSRPSSIATGDAVAKLARIVSGDSGWINVRDAKALVMQLHADAGTGTTPTLNVRLQTSFDGSDANAVDVAGGAFAQVAAAASNQLLTVSIFHPFVKIIWVVTGTTPSFNFGVYLTGR